MRGKDFGRRAFADSYAYESRRDSDVPLSNFHPLLPSRAVRALRATIYSENNLNEMTDELPSTKGSEALPTSP